MDKRMFYINGAVFVLLLALVATVNVKAADEKEKYGAKGEIETNITFLKKMVEQQEEIVNLLKEIQDDSKQQEMIELLKEIRHLLARRSAQNRL